MSLFKRSTSIFLVLFALLSHSVLAHTYLSSIFLNNQALAEGDCVRPHPSTAFDSPIPLVSSADMTCGWLPYANNAANRKCPISAGSSIGIQWHHNSASPDDDIIDPTHKGPVMVYLAKSDNGAGNVWFKIYEDGLSNGLWGVDRLIANKGRVDVTIPADIAPGNYLLRGEVIAHHGSYVLNGAQPYVGCVELTISGSGKATPAGVAFPGAYLNTDPGLLLSIYQGITSYIVPGPAVYKAGSSSSSSSGSAATPAPTTRPANPTTAPPSSPTTRPANPTTAPTARPTNPSAGNLKVQVNGGSNVWWFAVDVSGGSEETVKVELKDAGAVSAYQTLAIASYGFYFSQSVQLVLPVTLRLTSASGKQVELVNFATSFTDSSVKDTGKDYTTTTTPTQAATQAPTARPTTPATQAPTARPTTPATQAPTARPTSAPTNPPAGQTGVSVSLHTGSSAWWLALAVSGLDESEIAKVELKDASAFPQYTALASSNWGYFTFDSNGKALVAPLVVRVTGTSGASATATFNTITGGAVVTAN